MQRKSAILLAANQHFAHHGFRGASLRDIARDAGVSLTLLNHHFGSKFQLLAAVIDSHRAMLEDRSTVLLEVTQNGPGTYGARQLVEAWVRIAFDTAQEADGEMFLRLVARVIDDPSEEGLQIVRDKLDDAALVFIDALQQCYPHASRYATASVYLHVSATLLKFVVSAKRLFRLARASAPENARAEDQARVARFLVAGIEAALQGEAPSAVEATSISGVHGATGANDADADIAGPHAADLRWPG